MEELGEGSVFVLDRFGESCGRERRVVRMDVSMVGPSSIKLVAEAFRELMRL